MIGLTIRMNAARNDLTTADGRVIDRSLLTKPENRKVRRMVREIFEQHNSKQAEGNP